MRPVGRSWTRLGGHVIAPLVAAPWLAGLVTTVWEPRSSSSSSSSGWSCFGGGKLPDLARSLGRSTPELETGMSEPPADPNRPSYGTTKPA